MISGVVLAREARIQLKARGPNGKVEGFEAVIDTGFTGSLTLPPNLIRKLDLPWEQIDRSILADGSECVFDAFAGEIFWDGRWVEIIADEADSDPLVGMDLLSGCELKIQVRNRGEVTITKLQ
jgi:clan AA aspartic protease